MPIYEFHCEKCDTDSELLVRSSDWKGTLCPHCGSVRLTKKLSVFASSIAGGGSGEYCPVGSPAECGASPRSCGCACAGGKHNH